MRKTDFFKFIPYCYAIIPTVGLDCSIEVSIDAVRYLSLWIMKINRAFWG